jgi:hypothetical protein
MLIVLLAAIAVGCHGGGSGSTVPPTASGPVTSTPSMQVSFTPGSFKYVNSGLTVTLKLTTNTGTMVVQNETGHGLDEPGLYVEDGSDGHRIDGRVVGAVPIANGETKTFKVEFPPVVSPKEIGLVLLLFGTLNFGALAPN